MVIPRENYGAAIREIPGYFHDPLQWRLMPNAPPGLPTTKEDKKEKNMTTIDNTRRVLFQACPRKYYLSELKSLAPKQGASALRFGSAYHEGLAGFYIMIKEKGWGFSIEAREYGLAALKDSFILEGKDQEGEELVFAEDWRTVENCIDLYNRYLDENKGDMTNMEIIEVEPAFTQRIEHMDLRFDFIGRIDLIVKLNGTIWGMEHKTTGWSISQVEQNLHRSAQTIGYLYAMEKIFSKKEKEARMDTLLRALVDSVSKKDFNIAGMILNVASIVTRKSSVTGLYGKVNMNFGRFPHMYTEQDKQDWLESISSTVNDIERCKSRDFFPMNFDSCYQFGSCSYRGLCEQGRELKDIMTENYRIRTWDPRD